MPYTPVRSTRTLSILCLLAALISGCGAAAGKSAEKTSRHGHGSIAVPAVSAQRVSLALDWYPNSDHGGLYAAMKRGYFTRRGVQVQPYVPSDSTAQIRLVAAGRADFGITYETDLLAARVHLIPVKSVMCLVQHPLDTVMALKSSGIDRPRDLAGKTVGMAGAPSDRPMVAAMMHADGASIKQTRMENVGYKLLPILLAKKVDAVIGVYWTWEALQAQQRGDPVNVMRVERWGVPNYCELVLIASESTIRTKPALVRSVVQGMQQGYAYAEAHPAGAWTDLKGADPTLKGERALVEHSIALLRPTITGAPTLGHQNGAQWRRYAAWLTKNQLISGPVDASQAFTNGFLKPGVR